MKHLLLLQLLLVVVAQARSQKVKRPMLAPALEQYIAAAGRQPTQDSTDITVQWKSSSPLPHGWRLLRQYGGTITTVRIPAKLLSRLSMEQRIVLAGLAKKAVPELTTGSLDITLNKLNAAHAQFPHINGAAQRISLKEQRFDTTDLDYRERIFATGLEAAGASTHAAVMATITAGAGNTSEEAIGAAPGALVGSSSFEQLLPDPDSLLLANGVFIQNHSYGTVVENYYGLEAPAHDQQVYNLPHLLHVFSAGNSGGLAGAGTYNDVPGRANLTGNFKYAKNILTVGALDSLGNVPPQSSKGPAFDGRVKPELTAFGEDGSSGAAALVSGTAALLQQAYREAEGQLPPAALLKAVLTGSTFDAGPAGVDYQAGWGALDGLAALRMIKNKTYAVLNVEKGTQQVVSVNIPAGISLLRVTVSWTDPAAAANASKALVNDVDLAVRHAASGISWLPWVLNPAKDALDNPAIRSTDTLNNTEQVSIADPVPGSYQLVLDGSKLSSTMQEVAITWQMDTAGSFSFTYPTASDRVESGKAQLVRWQTTRPGNATLQASYDGANWQAVASIPDLAQGNTRWTAPDTNAVLYLRMLFADGAEQRSESFVVSRLLNLDVGFRCADSLMLTWSPNNSTATGIYVLSGAYLRPLITTGNSFAVVRTPSGALPVYSVAPLVAGRPGRRSFAFNTAASGVGCYFRAFFVQGQNKEMVLLRVNVGTLYNLASLKLQKKVGGAYQTVAGTTPAGLSWLVADSALSKGYNFYRVVAVLANGQEVTGEQLAVFHFAGLPVQAFPNPVKRGSVLYLQSELPGKYEVLVFDLYGRPLQKLRLPNSANPVAVQWPAGAYLLRISSDEGIVGTTQIVVY